MSATTQGAARLVDRDAEVHRRRLGDDEQVRIWADCLHAGAEGLVEVVAGRRRGDGALVMRSRAEPGHFPAPATSTSWCAWPPPTAAPGRRSSARR